MALVSEFLAIYLSLSILYVIFQGYLEQIVTLFTIHLIPVISATNVAPALALNHRGM